MVSSSSHDAAMAMIPAKTRNHQFKFIGQRFRFLKKSLERDSIQSTRDAVEDQGIGSQEGFLRGIPPVDAKGDYLKAKAPEGANKSGAKSGQSKMGVFDLVKPAKKVKDNSVTRAIQAVESRTVEDRLREWHKREVEDLLFHLAMEAGGGVADTSVLEVIGENVDYEEGEGVGGEGYGYRYGPKSDGDMGNYTNNYENGEDEEEEEREIRRRVEAELSNLPSALRSRGGDRDRNRERGASRGSSKGSKRSVRITEPQTETETAASISNTSSLGFFGAENAARASFNKNNRTNTTTNSSVNSSINSTGAVGGISNISHLQSQPRPRSIGTGGGDSNIDSNIDSMNNFHGSTYIRAGSRGSGSSNSRKSNSRSRNSTATRSDRCDSSKGTLRKGMGGFSDGESTRVSTGDVTGNGTCNDNNGNMGDNAVGHHHQWENDSLSSGGYEGGYEGGGFGEDLIDFKYDNLEPDIDIDIDSDSDVEVEEDDGSSLSLGEGGREREDGEYREEGEGGGGKGGGGDGPHIGLEGGEGDGSEVEIQKERELSYSQRVNRHSIHEAHGPDEHHGQNGLNSQNQHGYVHGHNEELDDMDQLGLENKYNRHSIHVNQNTHQHQKHDHHGHAHSHGEGLGMSSSNEYTHAIHAGGQQQQQQQQDISTQFRAFKRRQLEKEEEDKTKRKQEKARSSTRRRGNVTIKKYSGIKEGSNEVEDDDDRGGSSTDSSGRYRYKFIYGLQLVLTLYCRCLVSCGVVH